ncbi:hypothetical protein GCM10009551_081190 [Nocardiopsis tropica]|uniref:SWIM zinc finger family protein n=1 Tax=Tsukamurella strandjordii TaxID=147577 RepID=UPI0031DA0F47
MTTPAFGFTAWGSDLVRIAEPVRASSPNTLAPGARRIARAGCVALQVEDGRVTAHIHRGASASVAHLEFTAAAPAVVAALREAMGPRAEPDDAAHAAVVARGLRPAPVLAAADCSCRARTTMCVHVLAALYALAERVDHEPTTVLAILGFTTPRSASGSAGADRPVARWTPLAAVDVRDYFAAST